LAVQQCVDHRIFEVRAPPPRHQRIRLAAPALALQERRHRLRQALLHIDHRAVLVEHADLDLRLQCFASLGHARRYSRILALSYRLPPRPPLKSAPFDYVRTASLAEACALLARHDDAKLIAGGQSLVPMMAMRLVRPAFLVDINEIAALKFVKIEKDSVRIGASPRQCTVERDDALAAKLPLLRQALAWVGHVQTRNRGTVGGSLAHADPAAELPLAALVLGARFVLRSTRGARTVDAGQFFAGPMLTAARPHECL